MNELTIIIPTIGRKSILDTLKSVVNPLITDYIIVDDSPSGLSYNLRRDIRELAPTAKIITTGGSKGPGTSKWMGVNGVTTEYFLIMDDDDHLKAPGGISLILSILREFHPNWLSFHWGTAQSDLHDVKLRFVAEEDLCERLFDFSKYNPLGNFDVVYPGSSVVFQTARFRQLGIEFRGNYADDALAASVYMFNNSGIDILMNLGVVGHTTDSVSRGLPNTDDVIQALVEIDYYRGNHINTPIYDFLGKVIDNIFKRLNHIGFNKISRDEFAP